MTEWTVTINNISKNSTKMTVGVIISGDKQEYMNKTINLEGDNVDWAVIKQSVLKDIKRLDGIVNKSLDIEKLLNKTFVVDTKFETLTAKVATIEKEIIK